MLSVIIPCYNEEKLVKKSILEVLKAIKISRIKKSEIIIIDDGSKDKTLFALVLNERQAGLSISDLGHCVGINLI